MKLHLDIVTPEKKIHSEEADEVIVPTPSGQIGILPHHISLLTKIAPGELTIKNAGKEHILAITGGFLEVSDNKVTILAEYAIRSEDIEVGKAEEAQKKAQELLKKAKENESERDFEFAQSELRKSILQLKIAEKYRRRPRQ